MFICLQDKFNGVVFRVQSTVWPHVRLPLMKRKVLFLVALIAFATEFAQATTVQRLGLEDLVKKAHHIVVGKVRNSRTYWSSNGKLILTDHTVEVEEDIKGQSPHLLQVTTIGGKIGDLELHVSGMPSFQKDESVVLFTESSGPYEVVLGLGQGKFHFEMAKCSTRLALFHFLTAAPAMP